jgi:hypothetical protein
MGELLDWCCCKSPAVRRQRQRRPRPLRQRRRAQLRLAPPVASRIASALPPIAAYRPGRVAKRRARKRPRANNMTLALASQLAALMPLRRVLVQNATLDCILRPPQCRLPSAIETDVVVCAQACRQPTASKATISGDAIPRARRSHCAANCRSSSRARTVPPRTALAEKAA